MFNPIKFVQANE